MKDQARKTGVDNVQVSGLRLSYRRSGNGPPLVLLHGGMEDSRVWLRQLAALSDEFTVLAWDAPGCGASSDVPESWRMPDYADALAEWLRSIAIVRPHVLGLSWGSSIALELCHRHPGLPASLILASAYAGWAGSLTTEEVERRLSGVLEAADAPPDQSLRAFPGLFGPTVTPEILEEVRKIAAANSAHAHPGGYRAAAQSMAAADLRPVLSEIRVPTLLVYGELDERSPLHVAREIHSQIQDAELVVLPGVGHLVNYENPAAFTREIRRFLRRVVARGGGIPDGR